MLRPDSPLETARLVLRPFQARDLQGLYAFLSLPEVTRFLYWEARDLEQVRGCWRPRCARGRSRTSGGARPRAGDGRLSGGRPG